jgi:hypothetical protein
LPTAQRAVRAAVITQWITAVTAIGAVVFTGLSLNNASDQVQAAREQNQVAREQNQVAQQSQYNDRYANAVEQLSQQGTDRLQIRLGGIYALERLTRDTPRDQPATIEALSAFIRTSAPRPPQPANCPEQRVTVDIQAALTVLARRDPTHDNRTRIDLSGSCLVLSNLPGADLRDASLSGADLRDANLPGTNLHSASLGGADLRGADLTHTNLSGASLHGANLSGADLSTTYLPGANLRGASLRGANLRDASLSTTNLPDADLSAADLVGADLRGAYLWKAIHDARTDVSSTKTNSETVGKWW